MDVLADILAVTRLRGDVFWHTSADPPWGLRFEAAPVVWFHIVAAGGCQLVRERARPLPLGPSDLVLLPHGAGHVLCDDPASPTISLEEFRSFLATRRGQALTARRRPRERPPTELICGNFTLSPPRTHPVLRLLPAIVHVASRDVTASAPLQATLQLLLREFDHRDVGSETAVSRLLDVLFVHVIRHWLDTAEARSTGWLGALRDEPVGRALVLLHGAPARAWSVAALARAVGLSRPVFARRFAEKVGQTPLGYLRGLRIDIAARLLAESDRSLAEIAAAVGYTSEFAFNRAFQRARGVPPGRFRRSAQK
ncbi:MAG TPA: AraC family transcriptional regulator [Kofleriaceae bacterium]|nr:AraC family transcriptional regulator [Kofleriaceae bacterium]